MFTPILEKIAVDHEVLLDLCIILILSSVFISIIAGIQYLFSFAPATEESSPPYANASRTINISSMSKARLLPVLVISMLGIQASYKSTPTADGSISWISNTSITWNGTYITISVLAFFFLQQVLKPGASTAGEGEPSLRAAISSLWWPSRDLNTKVVANQIVLVKLCVDVEYNEKILPNEPIKAQCRNALSGIDVAAIGKVLATVQPGSE